MKLMGWALGSNRSGSIPTYLLSSCVILGKFYSSMKEESSPPLGIAS